MANIPDDKRLFPLAVDSTGGWIYDYRFLCEVQNKSEGVYGVSLEEIELILLSAEQIIFDRCSEAAADERTDREFLDR